MTGRCLLIHVPVGSGRVVSVTLCGRPVSHMSHTTAAADVTCPDCVADGADLSAKADRRCGRTWTVEGLRSVCAWNTGHKGCHEDPLTGAKWTDGATP